MELSCWVFEVVYYHFLNYTTEIILKHIIVFTWSEEDEARAEMMK